MLPTLPATSDYLNLSYRPDLATLVVRWLRAVSFAEVQEGFRAAREMSYSFGAARWLVDVRRRTELDAASSGWVATTLLPSVAAEAAPAVLHIAYLLSPARADMLEQDGGMRATTATARAHPSYQLQLFLDEGEAVNWLMG
ncbi:hypothetical protein [Hymenobacter actinosclerus]|uniref:SpoIIAA-like n=1 Tax=Hymenobacter actinosclerus TaxID=82805 RepID=A0A1I0GNR2_9BACT|nr:hypothetical protein [Hymenobacter actinosclerus]SET72957.1 hypothetical protein SAMN04487998_2515 [Hymenobacter actinosclerus]